MILKSEAVPLLAAKALTHYGSEAAVYANVRGDQFTDMKAAAGRGHGDSSQTIDDDEYYECKDVIESGDKKPENKIER